MRAAIALPLLLALVPAPGLAQAPDPVAGRSVLEELKAVRTLLERLEHNQRALIVLARIQIDEGRAAALEAQWLQLSSQEARLDQDMAGSAAVSGGGDDASSPPELQAVTASDERVVTTDVDPSSAKRREGARRADEARRARQNVEQQIARLRERIAAWEKYLDGVLR